MRKTSPFLPLLAAMVLPVAATAQDTGMPTTPAFQQVVRLAQDGYGDSARTMITRIIDRTQPGDASYPEALYTAATVARSGEEMRLLYSRVSVEFSRSAWADDALLRLAQLDYGAGRGDDAMSRVQRIFNEYPTSSVIPVAALWGARAAFNHRQFATGCDWIARGVAVVGDDVETRSQLEFARGRCTGTPVNESAPAPTTRPTPPPAPAPTTRADTPRTTPPAAGGGWRVQVGALNDEGAIRRVSQAIERAGFTVYRVAGPNGLTKVQAGPFATREAAQAQLARVKAAVHGDAFVTRAP